jgi:hypothetical protein
MSFRSVLAPFPSDHLNNVVKMITDDSSFLRQRSLGTLDNTLETLSAAVTQNGHVVPRRPELSMIIVHTPRLLKGYEQTIDQRSVFLDAWQSLLLCHDFQFPFWATRSANFSARIALSPCYVKFVRSFRVLGGTAGLMDSFNRPSRRRPLVQVDPPQWIDGHLHPLDAGKCSIGHSRRQKPCLHP